MTRPLRAGLLFLVTLGLVGCDHATKLAARAWLASRPPLALVGTWFDLRYAENRDTAFSLTRALSLPGKPLVLTLFAAAGLVAVLAWWWPRRRHAGTLERLGVAIYVAGALGNLVDRALRGYVVDFIHVRGWPVFNVADALLFIGAGLYVVATRPVRSSATM